MTSRMQFDLGSPQLSVVVCTFNRAALLAECLQSLVTQSLASSAYEVIVVDNNSSDSTEESLGRWTGKYAFIHHLREIKQGLSHARNLGWRAARGELVAYIDDDAIAASDWCERIIGSYRAVKPPPVAIGGPILPRLPTSPPWWYSEALETRSWGITAGFLQGVQARFGFSGSNMVFQRRVLSTYGGFNPAFGMRGEQVGLGEETQFFSRIYDSEPYFWYDPAIRVEHLVSNKQLRIGSRGVRAFQAGCSRRRVDGARLSAALVASELMAVFHAAKSLSGEVEKGIGYVLVSMLERTANRIGYLFTKADN